MSVWDLTQITEIFWSMRGFEQSYPPTYEASTSLDGNVAVMAPPKRSRLVNEVIIRTSTLPEILGDTEWPKVTCNVVCTRICHAIC